MAVDTATPKAETNEFQYPVSTYQVVEANPLASDARFIAAEANEMEASSPAIPAPKVAAKARTQERAAKRPAAKATSADEASSKSSTKLVIALGIGLGLLGALAIVAFVLLPGKSADTSYDMGTLTSTSNGLKGHLVTTWGNHLNYKLTIEPSDSSQLDSFITAIEKPKEPLAVNLQLKDVSGTVLCETPILLRYDPLKNIPETVAQKTTPSSPAKAKAYEAALNQAEIDQSLNKARMVSQELSREHGKDIFQTVNGEDGQISSLASQGTLPCTQKQYQNAAAWAFVTNFPSVLQPTGNLDAASAGLDPSSDMVGFGGPEEKDTDKQRSLAQQRARRRVALPSSHFSVEEDDALVGFQARSGIAETRSGKSFLVEKPEMVASSLKGVELPIPIHYRCDQLGACSLAGLHSGIQRAWLER
jgi:hypothetical protein